MSFPIVRSQSTRWPNARGRGDEGRQRNSELAEWALHGGGVVSSSSLNVAGSGMAMGEMMVRSGQDVEGR
jgi:hypothetical protein